MGACVTSDGAYTVRFPPLQPVYRAHAQVLSPGGDILAAHVFSVTAYHCSAGSPSPPDLFTPLVEGPITDYTTTQWWQSWPGSFVLTIRRSDGTLVLTRNFGWSTAGTHPFVWDGRNSAGDAVAPGA